jgi:2-oxoglutarate dehydrogenase E2 component (dihydrolipoamide succinyltransferase)
MRKKIAEHIGDEPADVRACPLGVPCELLDHREDQAAKKGEYERVGAKLTYMAFIAKAIVDALRRYPSSTRRSTASNVVYKKDINLGIAVALESG